MFISVGHILNVTREIDNFFPGMFNYLNVRVYDDEKTNLLKHWDRTFKYITGARQCGSKVLVHCKMGVSRSASVVIAYAMKAYSLNFATALRHVKHRRNCIKPNKSFLQQLETYQGMLDAMKNKEKLQRSKSETNLRSAAADAAATATTSLSTMKDGRLLPGSEPTPLIQALNSSLQMSAASSASYAASASARRAAAAQAEALAAAAAAEAGLNVLENECISITAAAVVASVPVTVRSDVLTPPSDENDDHHPAMLSTQPMAAAAAAIGYRKQQHNNSAAATAAAEPHHIARRTTTTTITTTYLNASTAAAASKIVTNPHQNVPSNPASPISGAASSASPTEVPYCTSSIIMGDGSTAAVDAEAVAYRLAKLAGVQRPRRAASWSPAHVEDSVILLLPKQQSQSLENLTPERTGCQHHEHHHQHNQHHHQHHQHNKNVLLPCSNGQTYSVSQNQVVHLQQDASSGSSSSSISLAAVAAASASTVRQIVSELESSTTATISSTLNASNDIGASAVSSVIRRTRSIRRCPSPTTQTPDEHNACDSPTTWASFSTSSPTAETSATTTTTTTTTTQRGKVTNDENNTAAVVAAVHFRTTSSRFMRQCSEQQQQQHQHKQHTNSSISASSSSASTSSGIQPSRNASWGSGDSHRFFYNSGSGTLPSRNSSWAAYDLRQSASTNSSYTTRTSTDTPTSTSRTSSSSSCAFAAISDGLSGDVPWHPGTVKRTKQKLETSATASAAVSGTAGTATSKVLLKRRCGVDMPDRTTATASSSSSSRCNSEELLPHGTASSRPNQAAAAVIMQSMRLSASAPAPGETIASTYATAAAATLQNNLNNNHPQHHPYHLQQSQQSQPAHHQYHHKRTISAGNRAVGGPGGLDDMQHQLHHQHDHHQHHHHPANNYYGNVHNLKQTFEPPASATGTKKVKSLPSSPIAAHHPTNVNDHKANATIAPHILEEINVKDLVGRYEIVPPKAAAESHLHQQQQQQIQQQQQHIIRPRPRSVFEPRYHQQQQQHHQHHHHHHHHHIAAAAAASNPKPLMLTHASVLTKAMFDQSQSQHHHLLYQRPPPVPPSPTQAKTAVLLSSTLLVSAAATAPSSGSVQSSSSTGSTGSQSSTNDQADGINTTKRIMQQHGKTHPLARLGLSSARLNTATYNTM